MSGGLRELATASIPGIDVDIIYNGVDVVSSSNTASSKRDDSCLRLLCVSRLIPRKGVADLLRALSTTPDIEFELTLAGTGPSFDDLRELARTLGIADKLNMVGYCASQPTIMYAFAPTPNAMHRDAIDSVGVIRDNVLYRSGQPERLEYEANRLAADLIMPIDQVQSDLASIGVPVSDVVIERLAQDWQVSKAAMEIRLSSYQAA